MVIWLREKLHTYNLSKFFYDIGKLSFGGFIIGSIISKEAASLLLIAVGLHNIHFCNHCFLVR
ncbi:MAG: DUF6722 family protein [bacterium]